MMKYKDLYISIARHPITYDKSVRVEQHQHKGMLQYFPFEEMGIAKDSLDEEAEVQAVLWLQQRRKSNLREEPEYAIVFKHPEGFETVTFYHYLDAADFESRHPGIDLDQDCIDWPVDENTRCFCDNGTRRYFFSALSPAENCRLILERYKVPFTPLQLVYQLDCFRGSPCPLEPII